MFLMSPYRFATSTIFLPTDITGCELWLPADYITGLVDGDAVTTWSDQSGLSNDVTQATASYKPLYKTNIVNGEPVVRFDATDDVLVSKSWGGVDKFSIFAVVSFADASTIRGICGYAGTNYGWHLQRLSDNTIMWYLYGPNISHTGSIVTSSATFYLISAIYDGATISLRMNGISDGSTACTGIITAGTINVGMAYNATRTLNGDLPELIFYNNVAVSGTDLSNIESFLMTKYAIT